MRLMFRTGIALALGLPHLSYAEVISTAKTCDISADLPRAPEIEAADSDRLTIRLPDIRLDVLRDVALAGRTFAEAVLARIVIDPQSGAITVDGDGDPGAALPHSPCD